MLAVKNLNRIVQGVMRSSLLWGGLAAVGFYTLIHNGTLEGEFFQRYFAAHWVLYAETIMFCVGVASLLLSAFDLGDQRSRLHRPLLGPIGEQPLPPAAAAELAASLQPTLEKDPHAYLPRRVHDALVAVARKQSAEGLEDELRYLAEVDAARAHGRHAFLKIIIWAIPILGFLGTVIGITIAIASLDPKALESSLDRVTAGLGVAFDTTALALTLSMILMFGQFLIDRLEGALLARVDDRASAELTGRFAVSAAHRDPQLASVQTMAEAVIRASEQLVARQAAVWQETIEAAHRRWSELTDRAQQTIETALNKSLVRGLQAHAQQLADAEAAAAAHHRKHLRRLGRALAESTRSTHEQQAQLAQQTEVLRQVVEATGQLGRLEEALNRNLATVAAAQHFNETMHNLSAAIHLLHARLGQVAPPALRVELKPDIAGKAA